MERTELLRSLCTHCAPSGREGALADWISAQLAWNVDELHRDALGNLIAVKRSKKEHAKTILLDAHMDEIAMMVTGITEEGFLRIADITGIDSRVMLAAEVTVHGREELFGVIACRPPHLTTAEERKKSPKVTEMIIDIGMGKERAETLVSIGDLATLRGPFGQLTGSRVSGKSLDNRTGDAVLLTVFDTLKQEELPYHLALLFSVQEEAGLRGAKVGAYTVDPDECIVVDVSFARTPDTKPEETGQMGGGPMIGIAPILSRSISGRLCTLAQEKKIPCQREVMGGSTGTNAYSVQIARGGVPVGLISIPLRYMHTAIECIDLADFDNTCRLLTAYLRDRGEALSR